MASFLWVGLGGALGAMLRYGISLLPGPHTFPVWTLLTNLLGALAIGFLAGLAGKHAPSREGLLFLKTGVCGGFTTFSTFSLETVTLFREGHPWLGAGYAAASVLLCLLGTCLGMALARQTAG